MKLQRKKILPIILLLLLLAGGLLWINKDIFHFESIHLIGRSFSEGESIPGLYRLTPQETLKKGAAKTGEIAADKLAEAYQTVHDWVWENSDIISPCG